MNEKCDINMKNVTMVKKTWLRYEIYMTKALEHEKYVNLSTKNINKVEKNMINDTKNMTKMLRYKNVKRILKYEKYN